MLIAFQARIAVKCDTTFVPVVQQATLATAFALPVDGFSFEVTSAFLSPPMISQPILLDKFLDTLWFHFGIDQPEQIASINLI